MSSRRDFIKQISTIAGSCLIPGKAFLEKQKGQSFTHEEVKELRQLLKSVTEYIFSGFLLYGEVQQDNIEKFIKGQLSPEAPSLYPALQERVRSERVL